MSLAIASAKPRGDPGLFGDILGTVTGIAASFIPGPAGALARAGQRKIFGGRAQPRPLPQVQQLAGLPMNGAGLRTTGRAAAIARGLGPGLPTQLPPGMEQETLITDITPAIACPKGYKPNKSAYYRRLKTPGNPEGQLIYVTPKSRCVRIRRRNPANPRAADRAIGRLESAKRFTKRMSRVTIRPRCPCPGGSRRKS